MEKEMEKEKNMIKMVTNLAGDKKSDKEPINLLHKS